VEEVRRFGESDDQQLEGEAGFVDLEANLAEPASQDQDADLEGPTLVVVDSDYSGTFVPANEPCLLLDWFTGSIIAASASIATSSATNTLGVSLLRDQISRC
jgi:hypothetical protein